MDLSDQALAEALSLPFLDACPFRTIFKINFDYFESLNATTSLVHFAVLHLFWAGNQDNHEDFNPSLLTKNFD